MSNEKKDNKPFNTHDSNPDPITKEPGAHPVGTGIGAAGAGSIGAVVGGVVGGPVGAVVGSVIGAVAGGLAGKGAAEKVNPTVEDEYWRSNYSSQPYIEQDHKYEDYQPAYRAGYEGYDRYGASGRTFDDAEPDLRRDYEQQHGGAGLAWEKAKHATKDAWHRVENALPGDDRTHDQDMSMNATSGRVNAVGQDDATVNLYEERLIADKHRERTGEVIVGKHVETETARVSVPLEKERVVIEQVSTSSEAVDPGSVRFGEEVARVELYEEVPEIHKEAFVREEVNVKKIVERDTVSVEEQLRREELDIDTQGRPVVDGDPNRPLRDRI